MKRTDVMIVILAVLFFVALFQPETDPVDTNHVVSGMTAYANSSNTQYTVDVDVNPEQKLVTGSVTAQFFPANADKVYFHLYANAFRDPAQLQTKNWQYIVGNETEAGEIRIDTVTVEGKSVPVTISKQIPTILEVPLPAGTNVSRMTTVGIHFRLKVPKNSGRLSYNEHAIWLGNWLPILAVNDKNGWHLDPYYPMGDPFYSESADYAVRVRVPDGYTIASSGIDSAAAVVETRPAKTKQYELSAAQVRDFAMVIMDDTYKVRASKAGNTLVQTWSQDGDDPEQVERLHQTAVEAINYYSKAYASYPYAKYDVVKTGGFFGGMEYPGLVFIQSDFFREWFDYGVAVVAHETAHQWFYGLVGSDEVREAWVDESLADYAAMDFLEQYDPATASVYIDNRNNLGKAAEQYAAQGLKVWQPLNKFPTWSSYTDLVYARGATMLWELRKAWGAERVRLALRRYVQTYAFKQASGADVVAVFSDVAKKDASPFFNYWLRFEQNQQALAQAWVEAGKAAK